MKSVIIMAGGLGKRMCSEIPKVLHYILHKPMLVHVIERAIELSPDQILIVVGKFRQYIQDTINIFGLLDAVQFVDQPTPLGTGHAIQCCLPFLNHPGEVVILSGDVPLIKSSTIQTLLTNLKYARVLVTELKDPTGCGRIIEKDGIFIKIVEEKDCNNEEKLCKKINSGIYAFDAELLVKALPLLDNKNSQNEYYLTDVVSIIQIKNNVNIDLYEIPIEDQIQITGVNTREQLEELERVVTKN